MMSVLITTGSNSITLQIAAVSLENYQLTVVTAKGTDTEIFDFAGNKWSVPGKGFIVIATRHPQYTDLATGKDVSLADDLQDPKGLKHLYAVKSVNLPDDGKFTLILRSAHDKEKTGLQGQPQRCCRLTRGWV